MAFNRISLKVFLQHFNPVFRILGAEVILRDKGRIRGLTTAATVWATASFGLAVTGAQRSCWSDLSILKIRTNIWAEAEAAACITKECSIGAIQGNPKQLKSSWNASKPRLGGEEQFWSLARGWSRQPKHRKKEKLYQYLTYHLSPEQKKRKRKKKQKKKEERTQSRTFPLVLLLEGWLVVWPHSPP